MSLNLDSIHSQLFTNLALLDDGCSSNTVQDFDSNVFVSGSQHVKAMESITFFLFNLLNQDEAKRKLAPSWPISDRIRAREYRNQVFKWLEALKKAGQLPPLLTVRRSFFDECRGERFILVLLELSNLVLRTVLHRDLKGYLLDTNENGHDLGAADTLQNLEVRIERETQTYDTEEAERQQIRLKHNEIAQKLHIDIDSIQSQLQSLPTPPSDKELNDRTTKRSTLMNTFKTQIIKLDKILPTDELLNNVTRAAQSALRGNVVRASSMYTSQTVALDELLPMNERETQSRPGTISSSNLRSLKIELEKCIRKLESRMGPRRIAVVQAQDIETSRELTDTKTSYDSREMTNDSTAQPNTAATFVPSTTVTETTESPQLGNSTEPTAEEKAAPKRTRRQNNHPPQFWPVSSTKSQDAVKTQQAESTTARKSSHRSLFNQRTKAGKPSSQPGGNGTRSSLRVAAQRQKSVAESAPQAAVVARKPTARVKSNLSASAIANSAPKEQAKVDLSLQEFLQSIVPTTADTKTSNRATANAAPVKTTAVHDSEMREIAYIPPAAEPEFSQDIVPEPEPQQQVPVTPPKRSRSSPRRSSRSRSHASSSNMVASPFTQHTPLAKLVMYKNAKRTEMTPSKRTPTRRRQSRMWSKSPLLESSKENVTPKNANAFQFEKETPKNENAIAFDNTTPKNANAFSFPVDDSRLNSTPNTKSFAMSSSPGWESEHNDSIENILDMDAPTFVLGGSSPNSSTMFG